MRYYLSAKTRTETKSPGGMLQDTWVYAFSFYAQIDLNRSSENFSSVLPTIRSSITFKTWLRSDLHRDMRVTYNGEDYVIVGITIGFKTMSIDCEKVE